MRDVIKQISLQDFIFSNTPTRFELNQYTQEFKPRYIVQVFRNHSFELVEHTIHAYLDYADLGIEFVYSGYDDSFSFQEFKDDADLYILWIDGTKYSDIDLDSFIHERIAFLRELTVRSILAVPYECSTETDVTDVTIFDLDPIRKELKDSYKDLRAKRITGTELSRQALLIISKELGLKYLPSLLKPAIKAIITDLDNTLYEGVLGEDGIEGVILTDGHKKLQNLLKKYADEGVFLCAVSKNEQEDVEKLLSERTDFPLKIGDFTKVMASWNSKSDSITELSNYMNIGTDSILFVDDNIGELMSVVLSIPDIRVVLAKENPIETMRVLECYPCLCMRRETVWIDRKSDTVANEERRRIFLENTKEEYIRKLGIRLTFDINNSEQIQRVSELANKTNQFIFSYKRYSVSQVEEIIKNPNKCIVSVSLTDSLSDSGLICVCVGVARNDYIEIEEVFMSCRALGRNIEDIIVLNSIKEITKTLGITRVKVNFVDGERNKPAREFFDKYLNGFNLSVKNFDYSVPVDMLNIKVNRFDDGEK